MPRPVPEAVKIRAREFARIAARSEILDPKSDWFRNGLRNGDWSAFIDALATAAMDGDFVALPHTARQFRAAVRKSAEAYLSPAGEGHGRVELHYQSLLEEHS